MSANMLPEQPDDIKERYQNLLDRITDAFIALDKDWTCIYANRQAAVIGRREPGSLVGKKIWDEFPEGLGSSTYHAYHHAMETQQYVNNIDYYEPLDLWFENHIYPSPEGLSIFIRDITERKKLEEELMRRKHGEQMLLTATALQAQEQERNLIGIELHDNVNQILVSAKLLLDELLKNPHRAADVLPNCIQYLHDAIKENRRIAHGLISPDLAIEDLTGQIKWVAESMLGAANIRTRFIVKNFADHLLNDEQKIAVYRIVQEQCSNIIKHAGALNVILSLTIHQKHFSLCIEDDGGGVDQSALKRGYGLGNIAGRVSVLGGEVFTTSAPGNGFILEVHFPLRNETPC